jgi:hypothetical protein
VARIPARRARRAALGDDLRSGNGLDQTGHLDLFADQVARKVGISPADGYAGLAFLARLRQTS